MGKYTKIYHTSTSMYWPQSIEIRQKFGLEGYGIYWALQELEENLNGIYMNCLNLYAYELHTEELKLKEIINYMLNQGYWVITDESLILINRKD